MTPQQAHQLKPGDTVRIQLDPTKTATVLDQFNNQLVLRWSDGEIRHHTKHSFPWLTLLRVAR
jgi:hypothetical protein